VLLDDDKHEQPVYAPVPITRESVLQSYPEIAGIVRPLMESFSRESLQELNARVQINGESPEAVAAEYLRTKGFLRRADAR
jgi:osmoprotectant transport system substrate-binding protein